MTTDLEPDDRNKLALEELGLTWRFQHSSMMSSSRVLILCCEDEYACFTCDGENYQDNLSAYLMGWAGAMQQVKRKLREEHEEKAKQEAQATDANCTDKLTMRIAAVTSSTPEVLVAHADQLVANAHEAEKIRNALFSAKLHISNTNSEMFAVVVGDAMLSFDGGCISLTEVSSEYLIEHEIRVHIVESTVIVDSECGGIVPTEILRSWLRNGEPGKKFACLFHHCMA